MIKGFHDLMQGDNPEYLKLREFLPEPTHVEAYAYHVMDYSRPQFSFYGEMDLNELKTISDIEFTKTQVYYDGCSFWAWKAPDGKIYL